MFARSNVTSPPVHLQYDLQNEECVLVSDNAPALNNMATLENYLQHVEASPRPCKTVVRRIDEFIDFKRLYIPMYGGGGYNHD